MSLLGVWPNFDLKASLSFFCAAVVANWQFRHRAFFGRRSPAAVPFGAVGMCQRPGSTRPTRTRWSLRRPTAWGRAGQRERLEPT